ncbi:hypothetical protein AKJ63_01840 [candidate division MSBL1 archaeon SCGC-AAA259D18]|uniref:2-phospho-L-lactate guanylyltransferase n=1 Tax=candidate division MSBL1 archaeon SCGC-AAA259D18 TaxID=1698262 RepID=A0A133UAE9_9EURY|nr:hypothetical protein AKJ63_01840 [candidate division MSBL1 archaeon SCGC-AAA259D18]
MDVETELIIPVKKLEESKMTFAEVFTDVQRRNLTLAMIEDVLEVARLVEGIKPAVVSPDGSVLDFVEERDVRTVSELDVGLNNALEIAIEKSIDKGFRNVLIIPGDVPLIKPDDLRNILDLLSEDRGVVITPSKEKGTNALLLSPPDVLDLHFGGESFSKHFEEARSRGIRPRIYRSERLERDIDRPQDLLKIEILGKGTKTHSFLDSLK